MVNYAVKYMEHMHYAYRNGFLPELRYMNGVFTWDSAQPGTVYRVTHQDG